MPRRVAVLQERQPHGRRGRITPVFDPELGKNVGDVTFDRALAEVALGDLRVRQPLAEESEHLALALGERDDHRGRLP